MSGETPRVWPTLHEQLCGSPRSADAWLLDTDYRSSLERWIVELRDRRAPRTERKARSAAALELLIQPERPILTPAEIQELALSLRDALWKICEHEWESWKGREAYPRKRREEWALRVVALRLYCTARELDVEAVR